MCKYGESVELGALFSPVVSTGLLLVATTGATAATTVVGVVAASTSAATALALLLRLAQQFGEHLVVELDRHLALIDRWHESFNVCPELFDVLRGRMTVPHRDRVSVVLGREHHSQDLVLERKLFANHG